MTLTDSNREITTDPRPGVLFLVHRIPYPPNKGDKIRSYQLLLGLGKEYRVHLGTFVDDPDDWQHTAHLETLTQSAHFEALKPTRAKLGSIRGLLTGAPLTLPYFHSRRLQQWVRATIAREQIEKVVVFSSSMAQYVEGDWANSLTRVLDFVDVDSDKWVQYAAKQRGVMRWLYRREGERLSQYEAQMAKRFNSSLFVSSSEASLFRQLHPQIAADKIGHLNNGVDSDYFTPAERPPSDQPAIVFTGAMDYWANVDAVVWFCREVWPSLAQRHPTLVFNIVGSNPDKEVNELAKLERVNVTGRVADVRPYLDAAHLVVAPLQIARGIQNKVLEAMAMAKPVVATTMAMEGIDAPIGLDIHIADQPQAYIDACDSILRRAHPAHAEDNRTWVQQNFSWDHNLSTLRQLLAAPQPATLQPESQA